MLYILSVEHTFSDWLLHQLAFAILFKDYVLVSLHDLETLLELRCTVLVTHPLLELRELARRNVDHLILADIAVDIGVLALVVNNGSTCICGLLSASIDRKHVEAFVVAILADVTD